MKRTKRALINAIWGFAERLIALLCPFIIRTITIYKLGNEYLGLSSLFSSILQVLSLAELGFGDAVIYAMYKPISEKDTEKLSALLNVYRKVYRLAGCLIFAVGIVLLPFLEYFIKGGYPSGINIYVLYLIYLFNTVISYFLFAYKESLLKANQRNDINSKILSACNLGMYLFQMIILLLFQNYYFYAAGLPLATIMINIARSKMVDKMFPEIKCSGSLAKGEIYELIKNVIGLMLNKISQVCRNSFDSIIISAFIGLTLLARYQNYYYIVNALSIIMSVFMTAIGAGIGNSIAMDSVEKNYRMYKELLFVYSGIACIFTACIICVMQDFIELWVGNSNKLQFYIVILCAVYFFSMRIGDVTAIYRQAAGLWWEDRYRPIVEAAANLLINIFLVRYWGIGGVLISTIISIVFINIPWASFILFKKYFKAPVKEIWRRMIKYVVQTAGICAVSFTVCRYIHIENLILRIMIRGIVCVIISAAILFAIERRGEEWKLAKVRVQSIFKRKGS